MVFPQCAQMAEKQSKAEAAVGRPELDTGGATGAVDSEVKSEPGKSGECVIKGLGFAVSSPDQLTKQWTVFHNGHAESISRSCTSLQVLNVCLRAYEGQQTLSGRF
jgi:hypothetical protein